MSKKIDWKERAEAAEVKLAAIEQAADDFAAGKISAGKLAEVLNCSDKHGFKQAAHAFCEADELQAKLSAIEEEAQFEPFPKSQVKET